MPTPVSSHTVSRDPGGPSSSFESQPKGWQAHREPDPPGPLQRYGTKPRNAPTYLSGTYALLAGAILDWADEDSEISPNGAESEVYSLKDPERQCKNGSFETVEELLLVDGAEWDVLYGEDANGNGILDPNEDDGDEFEHR